MQDRTDEKYRWRGIKARVPLFAFSLAAFFVAWYRLDNEGFGIWTWVFGTSILLGLTIETLLQRIYRCPICKTRLGPPQSDRDRENEFFHTCQKCGIRWYTKTYPADSS